MCVCAVCGGASVMLVLRRVGVGLSACLIVCLFVCLSV